MRIPSAVSRVVPMALLACAFMLTGCSKSGRTTAPAPINATQANDAAVQAAALIMAGGSPSPVPSALMAQGPAGFAQMRGATPNAAAAETTIVGEGFSWTFAIHWFNAVGTEQEFYNPLTTTRMVADSHGSGTYTGPNATMSLGTAGHLDVDGISTLQEQLHTNASENDTVSYQYTGPDGSASVRAYATGGFHDVVETKPIESNHPLSGSATWSLDVSKSIEGPDGSANEHFMATAVVTFNGTNLVPLVINGTWHFTLDLDTGEVTEVAV
ncbi:MAG: hypothetical protein ABL977_03265 [Candidatus Eisenbacteria bacterium]